MISLIINTKDAQDQIEACIKSAIGLFDELIIVDDGSKDDTVKIARKYSDKIYKHKSEGYVEPARNFAIDKARGEWILVLDTDEQLTPRLKDKLKKISKTKSVDFVKIPRKNIIFDNWIKNSGWWPDYQIRFFKKNKVKWQNEIHSQPITHGHEYQIDVDENLAIIHNNYQTISEFLARLNHYTDIEVKQSLKSNQKFNITSLLSEPSAEFIRRYFVWNGYKDGLHGLVLAILQAFSFFVVQIKLWQESKFTQYDSEEVTKTLFKEAKKTFSDVNKVLPKNKLQKIKGKFISKLL